MNSSEKPDSSSALRHVPERSLPVPSAASPALAQLKAGPLNLCRTNIDIPAEQLKQLVRSFAEQELPVVDALAARLGVTIASGTLAGVPVHHLSPRNLDSRNERRTLVSFHGGGYVFEPGRAGLKDAVLMAARGFRVVAVDYRMPPDFPYPAAVDDGIAVYRELVRGTTPKCIGLFGISAGAGLAMAVLLRAKASGISMPNALWLGTPWSDLSKTGDSYFLNDHVDEVLISYEGFLEQAAQLYAAGCDLKDPELSPVYGDLHGFPPSLLTTGTRDLFLSNTIRVHRKLLRSGVQAQLSVFEGMSHGDYESAPETPESDEIYAEACAFFDANLD